MRSNQKGFSLALILIIIVSVLGALFLLVKKGIIPQQTANVPTIQNTSGLDSASKDLDNTNLNQIDPGLTQLNSDTSF